MEGELWLAAQPSELAKARDFAESGARAFCFDDHGRYEFTFAASEAVANAIEHGASSSDGKIHLHLVGEGDKLTLFVRDSGTFVASSPDPSEVPQRGRGLAFMVSLMDEVEVRTATDSTLIRLSKRLPPAGSTARCRTGCGRRVAAAAAAVMAALVAFVPSGASAHVLSEQRAAAEATSVAGFVAGVLTSEYRVRRFGVGSCVAHGPHKVRCKLRWRLAERRIRRRWSCSARIVVFLPGSATDETDWTYGRPRCASRYARAARGR